MNSEPVIAVVGATGLVGNEISQILGELKVPHSEIRLLASKDSAGEVYEVAGNEVGVEELHEGSFEGVDIALFAVSGELAAKFVPVAVESGATVIDNSSKFRLDDAVPLVVPEVNFNAVKADTSLIANPNCSTIQLIPVLAVLDNLAGLKRVVVSTYQSVSGAGKAALDELWHGTRSILNQSGYEAQEFEHQIAFNCIPKIDVMMEDGYTREEQKIIKESRKILGIPDLRITATAVRVPVFYSHAESVNVETERSVELKAFRAELEKMQGISCYHNSDDFPLQVGVAGENDIHVGRIRLDDSVEYGVNFWVVADNVRKGAALNAVQIAQKLIESRA